MTLCAAFVLGSTLVPLTGSASASAAELSGAGSTLIAPLLEGYWAPGFEREDGVKVKYGAVGSGAGIEQISARAVDFGASDAPLTPAQSAGCHGCIQVPWALTATGIAYHIEGISRLRLSGPVLADIYLGKITNWDDPAIARLNKGEHLPNLPISVVYRSDGSGDTYAFTDYLSRISPEWKSRVGNATSVSFPVGTGGKGNAGVTAVVVSTNGAIGYISASYIIAHHLGAAALENAAHRFIYPNLRNIEDAALSIKRVPANNEMHIVNPPAKYRIAYPLSTFTYCLVPENAPQKALIGRWVTYAVTTGQRYGAALDFAPIPKVVRAAIERTLRRIGS
ncbi:MAG TPA: phosphate ABC transporter substrate-binding protein PstS [Solirubrobacteraceae bacterium]|nr:phosphate ABC transporter substrate-binding protein PstS [Solirubrobacteraceae bacterium]